MQVIDFTRKFCGNVRISGLAGRSFSAGHALADITDGREDVPGRPGAELPTDHPATGFSTRGVVDISHEGVAVTLGEGAEDEEVFALEIEFYFGHGFGAMTRWSPGNNLREDLK